jgi:hypothetical protein
LLEAGARAVFSSMDELPALIGPDSEQGDQAGDQ